MTATEARPDGDWPPAFTLDQARILNLLTGDRFYSNPSAALREAVLNGIDAIYRRRTAGVDLTPQLDVTFNRENLSLAVSDNGIGMNRAAVVDLFTKVGASAARAEAESGAVGEFGIGVVSYFMAGDEFELQTHDGMSGPLGLVFHKEMLAGGGAVDIPPTRIEQGTTVTLRIKTLDIFDLLLEQFPHWCRDVEGLSGRLLPDDDLLGQGGADRLGGVTVPRVDWVEKAHLAPVARPSAWDAMTGISTIAVLYRGVFVQEVQAQGIWGIEGSIDVNPKHFRPKLNREGFIGNEFQQEVQTFLKRCHPAILTAMAIRLAEAIDRGALDKWDQNRWATLWLSVPRNQEYLSAVEAWDAVFRSLPAFEVAVGNQWKPASLRDLSTTTGVLYVAPLKDEKSNDLVAAATRFLRNTGETVIRGVRRDRRWMPHAPTTYGTTADLITHVFADELPPLIPITSKAEQVLNDIEPIATLFTGPPRVDLVTVGPDSPPALRLRNRLIINTDHPSGTKMAYDALAENNGAMSLVGIAARHAYEQLAQVAAVARENVEAPEVLSPIRRRYIRSLLR